VHPRGDSAQGIGIDREAEIEELRKEAQEMRKNAKTAKDKGDLTWKDWHAKLKDVHRRMEERGRRERRYRTGLRNSRERNIGNANTVETAGTIVTATTANIGAGIVQQEEPEGKAKQAQLGRSAFIGGIAPGTSSGTLQRHLQQFAQVKYCALLAGTLNDEARSAMVTFTNHKNKEQSNGCI
jgi:hypothetical protein